MLVPELDTQNHFAEARRFGSSWNYIKRTTATRENLLDVAIKSSVRGVQWIEPALRRPLADLWKIGAEARDLEARRSEIEITPVPTALGRKAMTNSVESSSIANSAPAPVDAEQVEKAFGLRPDADHKEEIAPGIDLKSTNDPEAGGLEVTSISVGQGGIGKDVKKVRRTG